jgi:hypothetical protein
MGGRARTFGAQPRRLPRPVDAAISSTERIGRERATSNIFTVAGEPMDDCDEGFDVSIVEL